MNLKFCEIGGFGFFKLLSIFVFKLKIIQRILLRYTYLFIKITFKNLINPTFTIIYLRQELQHFSPSHTEKKKYQKFHLDTFPTVQSSLKLRSVKVSTFLPQKNPSKSPSCPLLPDFCLAQVALFHLHHRIAKRELFRAIDSEKVIKIRCFLAESIPLQ